MALIYNLQVSSNVVERIQQRDEELAQEVILFESTEEKAEFLADPEAFMRKIRIYTAEMPFNGVELPPTITMDKMKVKPESLMFCMHRCSCRVVCMA